MKKILLLFIITLFSLQLFAQQPTSVRHYREDAGVMTEIVNNTAVVAYNGTPTLITDRKNQTNSAFQLNGGYFASSIGGQNYNYSISFFIKTTTTDNSVRTIVDCVQNEGTHIYLGNGKIWAQSKFHYYWAGNPNYSLYQSNNGAALVNDGEWHSVIFRLRTFVSGSNPYFFYEIFIDGVLDSTVNYPIGGLNASGMLTNSATKAFYIGAKITNLTAPHYEDGIDDIKFFNYALTDADIVKLSKDRENPKTFYVDASATGNNDGSSWANAFTSLVHASNSAVLIDDEIWIAKGNYTCNTSDRTKSFKFNEGVKVYGGFIGTESSINDRDISLLHTTNATILNGDLAGDDDANITFNNSTRDDNSHHVITIENNNVYLNRLTIANGYADQTAGDGRYGAGIYKLETVANLTIEYCKIKGNVAYWAAGFIFNNSGSGTIKIDKCIFENNLSSSSATAIYGYLNATNTTVMNVEITNCLFSKNYTNDDTVKNRKAAGAPAGSIRALNGFTTINLKLINNTFVSNMSLGTATTTTEFPVFSISQQSGTMNADVANNIFYYNLKNGNVLTNAIGKIADTGFGSISVKNSIDEDAFSNLPAFTTHNIISANPLFVNAPNGDYSLQVSSPAINMGDNSTLLASMNLDLLGNSRIYNTTVDMGAIEDTGALSSQSFSQNNSFSMYPNPVADKLYIENTGNKKIDKIQITDITGKVVKNANPNSKFIDLSNLKLGFYIVTINSENKIHHSKLIKK